MAKFGDDLIHALSEALDHAKGEGNATVHPAIDSAKSRLDEKPTVPEAKHPPRRHSGAA